MRIVLLGDSHLQRVQRDLKQIGPNVVNAAVGGAVVADVAAQARSVPVTGDDVAVLSIGTNDSLRRERSLDEVRGDVDALLSAVRPRRWVYVGAPLPASASYSAVIAGRVNAVGGTTVDTAWLLYPLGARAYDEDAIHLTGRAYALLLPALHAAVSRT